MEAYCGSRVHVRFVLLVQEEPGSVGGRGCPWWVLFCMLPVAC
jgi:hypothetical protein